MDPVVVRRREIFREQTELKRKPYLSVQEQVRLQELNKEWDNLLLCGDVVRKKQE